jgi:hypothetical protein
MIKLLVLPFKIIGTLAKLVLQVIALLRRSVRLAAWIAAATYFYRKVFRREERVIAPTSLESIQTDRAV